MWPELFTIFGLPLRSFGFFVALGFIVGVQVASWLSKRYGSDPEHDAQRIPDLSWAALIGVIAGARLAYVLVNLPYYLEHPVEIFQIWQGGLVMYGGMILALVLGIRKARQLGMQIWQTADYCLTGAFLGQAIGRIGCLLNWYGEAGSPTHLPWAFVVDGVARHPVTGYLSLLYILGGLVLTAFGRSVPRGTAGATILYYALVRSLCEPWREYEPPYLRELSLAMCAILALFGLILFRWKGRVPATSVETFS